MNLHELVTLSSGIMKTLHQNGIKVTDYKYLDIYEEYLEMMADGEKVTYIVTTLSSSHDVGIRTIYRIIDKFRSDAVL